MTTFFVSTTGQTECVDITQEIKGALLEEEISDGMVVVFVPHTTAGITINEGADPNVQEDLLRMLNQVIPFKGPYRHGEGNSPAHIKTSLIGSSVMVLIESGRLILGTWQSIFLCEFDGPRTRKVMVKFISR
jgi:secondary thiamine-phosphate synthase enzyme